MKKVLALAVVVGFLAVDFLFFHDIFKPGELTTFPQYLTGFLSIPTLAIAVRQLLPTVSQR